MKNLRVTAAGIVATLFLLMSVACSHEQRRVIYEISFENAAHHEARVSATFMGVPSKTLEVRMSRSSPGRYALHEFAKNVYAVKAFDGNGDPLQIVRPNPYQWDISGHDGTVKITYTLFADRADGTYSGIDETHAHLNMPATFMWARGMEESPIEIIFHLIPGAQWKVASQLKAESGINVYSAPNLQYFMDSPTELSDYSLREWNVESNGKRYAVRLAVHHDGSETDIDAFRDMVKAVIAEQEPVYGEYPDFDYGDYTFIACYLPYVSGDGMEHRNSTILTSIRPLRTGMMRNLGTAAHEFFHSWNVERMRPKTLEPFNYEHANMSGELWFAEGFTSYYDDLTICRAGLKSIDEFASGLAGRFNEGDLNMVTNSPGRTFFTPVEMSQQAPFVDAAASIDPTNRSNTFISYYTYGNVIALGLDLTMRTRFDLSLDDFMKAVWEAHGRTEIPYTVADLQTILAKVTGDQTFAEDYFDKYIYGHELPDYKELLSHAGFLLRKAFPGGATLGSARIWFQNRKAVVSSYTLIGSPLYSAGVDAGDTIISIDDTVISSQREYEDFLNRHNPGDTVPIRFVTRAGVSKSSMATFAEHKRLEVVTYEDASLPVTEEIQRFRENWLGSRLSK